MSPRSTTVLTTLLGVAFVVSVVHYVDNVANYADYPDPSGGPVPAPSATLIAISWFVFTAAGVAGLVQLRRGRTGAAAVLLALYSGSGIIGIGHYTVPGAIHMVWWRQVHVVADIVLGLAILGFALWAATRGRHRTATG